MKVAIDLEIAIRLKSLFILKISGWETCSNRMHFSRFALFNELNDSIFHAWQAVGKVITKRDEEETAEEMCKPFQNSKFKVPELLQEILIGRIDCLI